MYSSRSANLRLFSSNSRSFSSSNKAFLRSASDYFAQKSFSVTTRSFHFAGPPQAFFPIQPLQAVWFPPASTTCAARRLLIFPEQASLSFRTLAESSVKVVLPCIQPEQSTALSGDVFARLTLFVLPFIALIATAFRNRVVPFLACEVQPDALALQLSNAVAPKTLPKLPRVLLRVA